MDAYESRFGRTMNKSLSKEEQRKLAELIKGKCIRVALEAYEQASISGLCHEGAWEFAIDSMKNIKIEDLLKKLLEE